MRVSDSLITSLALTGLFFDVGRRMAPLGGPTAKHLFRRLWSDYTDTH